VPQAHPVQQVAGGPAKLKSEAQAEEIAGAALAPVYEDQDGNANKGHQYQREILVLEQAEGAARIESVGEPKKSFGRKRLTEFQ
jgi:hypothetical protein